MKTKLYATIISLLIITNSAYSSDIYHWVDDSGRPHFSDSRATSAATATSINLKSLPSIKTVVVKPKKTIKQRKQKRSHFNRHAKITKCVKIKQKIDILQRKLKAQLGAGLNDSLSQKLTNLRWEKIKKC